jgi:hypothetical protein
VFKRSEVTTFRDLVPVEVLRIGLIAPSLEVIVLDLGDESRQQRVPLADHLAILQNLKSCPKE